MARRSEPSSDALRRGMASAVIVTVLFLQLVASFHWFGPVFGQRRRHGFFWPFLDYPMYSRPHYQGEPLPRYRLFGAFADGSEAEVTSGDLGLNFWKFEQGPVQAILRDEPDRLNRYVEAYRKKFNRQLVRLRLENHARRLSPQGIVTAPPEVIKTVEIAADSDT